MYECFFRLDIIANKLQVNELILLIYLKSQIILRQLCGPLFLPAINFPLQSLCLFHISNSYRTTDSVAEQYHIHKHIIHKSDVSFACATNTSL